MVMSVRMTSLPIIFLLMIHSVSSADYAVSYSRSTICALKDSTVIMSCHYSYPHGHQIRKVYWTNVKDEEFPDLSDDPKYSQRLQYQGDQRQYSTIKLSHVTLDDSHKYYLRIITDEGKWLGHPGVRLSVTDLHLESPERVTEGDSVHLTCKSSCELTDRPTFIWSRNSQRFPSANTGNKLTLSAVTRGDAGTYRCAVDGHNLTSDGVQLNVMYPPDRPEISMSGSGEIVEGDSVSLTCSSDSNPPAQINWFKGKTYMKHGQTYTISNISSDDSGKYKCKFINTHGVRYSKTLTVNVMYPPRNVSVSISGSAEIYAGDSVSLICETDSNPPAQIHWFKENQSSSVGSGQSFSVGQSGRFYCQALNRLGSHTSHAVSVTVCPGAGVNVTGITVMSGGSLFVIIIILLSFMIQRKRINRQYAQNKKDNDPSLYNTLELKSSPFDLDDTFKPVVHQSDSEYENLPFHVHRRSSPEENESFQTQDWTADLEGKTSVNLYRRPDCFSSALNNENVKRFSKEEHVYVNTMQVIGTCDPDTSLAEVMIAIKTEDVYETLALRDI